MTRSAWLHQNVLCQICHSHLPVYILRVEQCALFCYTLLLFRFTKSHYALNVALHFNDILNEKHMQVQKTLS